MMNYKFTTTEKRAVFIIQDDNSCSKSLLINGADPANTDYQEYLKWVTEGNTPEPADE
jgi:hypothetical protein